MGLTIKSSYALRALHQLALFEREGKERVSVSEIAEVQDIPKSFLEKIFVELKDANIVEALRGRHGGYRLARSPKDIRLDEIVRVLDKTLLSYECIIKGKCPMDILCAVEHVWKRVNRVILSELAKITLQDLLDIGDRMLKAKIGGKK